MDGFPPTPPYLFTWLCRVLVAVCGIVHLRCGVCGYVRARVCVQPLSHARPFRDRMDCTPPGSLCHAGSFFSCSIQILYLWHVGSNSLRGDWTQAPCIESRVIGTGLPGKSLDGLLTPKIYIITLYMTQCTLF